MKHYESPITFEKVSKLVRDENTLETEGVYVFRFLFDKTLFLHNICIWLLATNGIVKLFFPSFISQL